MTSSDIFHSGQLGHQNRVLQSGQTEEREALQCQRTLHEGQNTGELTMFLHVIHMCRCDFFNKIS